MEVIKLLKVNGATEPNAAMLNDSGEEYPVFLKSLHNTILFEDILNSGYKLAGMPYDFVKDGKSIMELPVEVYEPTQEQMQQMYDFIGQPHEMSYLLSKVDTSIVRGLPTPETNYTITTRDAFLKYLTSLTYTDSDEEFLPINYFVSPEARFTMQEYFASENARFIRIMERHRVMSYKKFQNLFKWLMKFGLSPNASFLDVIEAYLAWGVDGLNTLLISKNRTKCAVEYELNSRQVERRINGLIDGNGNIYPPTHERNTVWHPDVDTEERLRQAYRHLAENEVSMIRLKTPSSYDVIAYNGVELQMEASDYRLKLFSRIQNTIVVKSISNSAKTLPCELALPVNKAKMLEYCLAEAIATDNYLRRKDNTKVSSYQVLAWSGASPDSAIRYMLKSLDMLATSSDRRFTASGDMRCTPTDVNRYLAGKRRPLITDENGNETTDPNDLMIYDIVHGSINTDAVEKGMASDAIVDAGTLRDTLITLHNTLGITYEDMYKKLCVEYKPDMKKVLLSNGQLTYVMDVSRINNAVVGYETDMREYDNKRANACEIFYYVTLVAMEVAGNDGIKQISDRAVGIESLTVNLVKDKAANAVISMLINKLLDAAEMTQMTVSVREQLEDSARRWALNSWFEIYARGTYTLPTLVGGITTTADEATRQTVLNCTHRTIDSTVGYCNLSFRVYDQETRFASYCVNAYVSFDRVIPRSENSPIHAVPFYAVWCDYARTNPKLHATLVERGVLKNDFVAWERRYGSEQLWREGDQPLYSNSSLLTYYEDAVQHLKSFPEDEEFVAVPHYIDIAYPGLMKEVLTPDTDPDDDNDDDKEEKLKLAVPRKGQPVIRVGMDKMLKLSEMRQYIKPTEQVIRPDTYIQRFIGFKPEVLLKCPNVIDKIPTQAEKTPIMVISGYDKILLTDTNEMVDYSRVATLDESKYPISHIYDRTWMLCTMDGQFWEVCI